MEGSAGQEPGGLSWCTPSPPIQPQLQRPDNTKPLTREPEQKSHFTLTGVVAVGLALDARMALQGSPGHLSLSYHCVTSSLTHSDQGSFTTMGDTEDP